VVFWVTGGAVLEGGGTAPVWSGDGAWLCAATGAASDTNSAAVMGMSEFMRSLVDGARPQPR
jgi:hypothetical protein